MDDKELINRVKNSYKAKKSTAEILNGFQKRGYKLAYADKIISKAKRPKKVLVLSLLSLVMIILLATTAYSVFFTSPQFNIKNPLDGLSIITGNAVAQPFSEQDYPESMPTSTTEMTVEEIKITPDFVSYILQEIGASKLHKNPLTFEKPIINFEIDGETFYSEIGREIVSKEGLNDRADLQFNTNKPDLIKALSSNDPEAVFKNSLNAGQTQVEIFASKPELFSKGYLNLYDSLK